MSSMSSALALPTPGPSTIRLALLRTALELFETEYTRHTLFPIVRSMAISIRPPEKIALSHQRLRSYKGIEQRKNTPISVEESIMIREVAHASGTMTVYVHIPREAQATFSELFATVGYWGKADSFASCISVREESPVVDQCVRELSAWPADDAVQEYYSSIAADFANFALSWEQVMGHSVDEGAMLTMTILVWPMVRIKQPGNATFLQRYSYE